MASRHEHVTEAEFQAIGKHLDDLVREFETLPFPEIREKIFDLLQTVDALHRIGLSRLIDSLPADEHGPQIDRLAADPIVHTLLTLYDLMPTDPRTQVETALETVRPYIHSHGGRVEVLDVIDGIVHLRLSGSCHGCPGSTLTLKRSIETALGDGFPGFKGIQVHDALPKATGKVIPMTQIGAGTKRAVRRPVFTPIAPIDEIPAGTAQAYDMDGVRALVANVNGEIYAVRNTCPGSVAPLHLGDFRPPVVECPWHHERYDIRTGKRADGVDGPPLAVLPVALVDGMVQVAVNTLPDMQGAEGR